MWEEWCWGNGGIYLKSVTLTIEVQFPINSESSVILDRITRQVCPSAKIMKTARWMVKWGLSLDLMTIRLLLWCEVALSGKRSYTEVCVNEETLNPAAARPLKWSGPLSHVTVLSWFFLLAHEKPLFPFFKSSEE